MFTNQLNKVTSVLSTAAILAGLCSPVTAYAAAGISVTGVQAVSISMTSTDYKDLGQVKIEVPIEDLNINDFFLLRLPTDFKIHIPAATDSATDIASAKVTLPDGSTLPLIQAVGGSDPWNDGVANHLAVYQTNANELKVVVKNPGKASGAGTDANTVLKVNLGSVYIPGSAEEKIEAIVEAQPGSAFTNDTVILANKGMGTVNVSVDSVKTIPESGDGVLDTVRFKEDSPGALTGGSKLKLTLPNGFEWSNSNYTLNFVYGDKSAIDKVTAIRSTDRRELELQIPTATNAASYFTISNAAIAVQDSKVAQFGDITLSVSGSGKTNVSTLVVGKYVTYATTVSAENAKNVLAGRAGMVGAEYTEIGQLVMEENAPGSLREGGTIRIRLDGGVKWAVDEENQLVQAPQMNSFLSDRQGFQIDESVGNHGWQLVDDNTIMATIEKASNGTKGSKIVWDKGLVDIPADAEETDIHAVISGNAGVSGDAGVIAKIVKPVSLSVPQSTLIPVQSGVQNKVINDIVIKENVAGAIDTKGTDPFIQLTFQQGVEPNRPDSSQIKVDGDLVLDTADTVVKKNEQGRWYIQIPVQASSTKPSTITFTDMKVTVDRTVAEGNLIVDLGGSMIQTAGSGNIATVAVGNVVFPTNGSVMNSATFVIGSTSYTVNDEKKTLDVAPFIDKNGRTLLPVRAVAEAFDAVVGWDPEDGTVSFLKGGKAVSITVGSYVMNVGGVFVQLESPAVNKNGRVFLPIRVIAEAFGAKINWDANTQTVYLN